MLEARSGVLSIRNYIADRRNHDYQPISGAHLWIFLVRVVLRDI